MVAVARACTHWQLTRTPRHKDTAMNHIRRIAITLAGLAAPSARPGNSAHLQAQTAIDH